MWHLGIGLLRVQQAAAEKVLEYNKVDGVSNPSEMLTEYSPWGLTERFAKMLGCDFTDGINKFGYEIARVEKEDYHGQNGTQSCALKSTCGSNPPDLIMPGADTSKKSSVIEKDLTGVSKSLREDCHGCSGVLEATILELVRMAGTPDACVWSRCDMSSSTLRSTNKGGPHWRQVIARASVRRKDQERLEANLVEQIPRCLEHAKLIGGKTDLNTCMLCVQDAWSQRNVPSVRN